MKKSFKHVVFMLALVLVFTPLIQGCSNSDGSGNTSDGDTITLKMSAWGNPEELKVYQRGVDAFMEKNPNIKVEIIPIPSDSYEQKLMTELSGGKGPDVFYVGDATMAKLAKNQSVISLTDFMKTSDSYTKDDLYSDGLWGAAKQNSKIYGIPVDCNPLVLYYNKKLFKELGIKSPQEYFEENDWNWETFKKVTGKFKDAGKYGFVQDSAYGTMASWVWSNGGLVYDKEGNYVLDTNKKAQEAIQYINGLVQDGRAIYAGSLPKGQGLEAMFMSRQVGMVAAGRWLTPLFSKNGSLEFDYIYWPTNTDEKYNPVQIPTAYLSVNANTEHQKAAKKFVTFYTSKMGQKTRLSQAGNAIPSVKGINDVVLENAKVEHADYLLKGRQNGVANGSPRLFAGNVPGLQQDMSDIYDLMLLGKQDADTTIHKITEATQKKMKEYQSGQ
ncbi:ABC transporter substrate-binding protein [Tuberibacillus sp. Marseille-P3662]|uniref:ABC transporter substrate-binding protein n=1 Tax=Tuberibacillus sp. Marseille-P3662 TaxID=1965358 RepID=UPI000A1CE574|nr:sugar ABC transporter substrate-binding protein [Tuberibacillus sp. Marseille-P3662]